MSLVKVSSFTSKFPDSQVYETLSTKNLFRTL
jgi:hypothetical protein